MKLTIKRGALLNSLQHVQSVVERRNTIPILSNVQLSAQGSELGLTATDMDIWVYDKTPAEVKTPGSVTASAHMLFDIVRKLPEESEVELELGGSDGQLSLSSGHTLFSLASLPVEDFPSASEGDWSCEFEMPAEAICELIDRARFAMSTEETRYYLNGIFLHPVTEGKKRNLRAVATDGHRLARVDVDLPKGADEMPSIILPRKAVLELRKLFEGIDGGVVLSLSDTKARFSASSVVLTTKLIDGTFPDYQRVIPDGNSKMLSVTNALFSEAVDRVSTVSKDKTRAIKLALKKNKLLLTAHTPDHGSASEELDVEYESEDLEVGFNARYLLEMTEQIRGERISFQMEDGASPAVVGDGKDPRTIYVLMPMRV
ncbi:MAG: DNA polymerase III subunit beta [Pseudomonadota bacterium]|nr:DNA polymerase III subunit beta [Pseudomonadota bacterium]